MDLKSVFEEMHRPPEPTLGFEIHPDKNPTKDANSDALTVSTKSSLSKQAQRMKEMEALLRKAEQRDDIEAVEEQREEPNEPITSTKPVDVVFQSTQRSLSKSEKALAEMKAALEAKMIT
jgi:hypothetical protein